jgi:tetratricopeptide (TPR) repeat protein
MDQQMELLLDLMEQEKYKESVSLAHKILQGNPTQLDAATCLYTIGYAKRELGEGDSALPFLLEAVTTFPTTEPALIANAQAEVARFQFASKHFKSALFFIEMAIDNFTTTGLREMKVSCESLRKEILGNS